MKNFMKTSILILFTVFFTSCQSGSEVKEILAKQESRKEIMDSIASNSNMSGEMMDAMMSNNNSKMMIQGNKKMNMMIMENHTTMMQMMKDNPGMMQGMMADMMETCKGDSVMMSGMCKTMMGDPKMMDMMQKMKGKNTDMNKMKGMDKMDNKSHH